MIGTQDISISAHNPQFPLECVFTYINSPSSIRLRNVPRSIGQWKLTNVYFDMVYPNGETIEVDCVMTGGVWIGTVDGCEVAGTSKNGFIVKADGVDENNKEVNGYVLGVGDVHVLDQDGRIVPQESLKVVNIVPSKSSVPHVGDAVWVDGVLEIYDGQVWKKSGSGVVESQENTGYARNADNAEFAAAAQSASYAANADTAFQAAWAANVEWDNVQNKPSIPTKTSDLINDEDFVDRDFVNSSIATNTANFKGTFNNESEFPTEATNNDYLFWKTIDDDGNTIYKRYKYIASTSTWTYEYTLNNSSFTAQQWATINGGPYGTAQDVQNLNDWCYNLDSQSADAGYRIEQIEKDYATQTYVDSQIGQVLTEGF